MTKNVTHSIILSVSQEFRHYLAPLGDLSLLTPIGEVTPADSFAP